MKTPAMLPTMVSVLLVGVAVYLHGFLAALPYQLEPDEPNIWLFANRFNTTGSFYDPDNFFPYPPLGLLEVALEHRLLQAITPAGRLEQPVYYVMGRYFSVLYSTLMLAFTFQAGKRLHSPAAGIAAMLFLAAQPDAVYMTKLIKVDNTAWMFGMLSLLLSIYTARSGKRVWLIGAFLAALAATATKYTMLPIFAIPGLALILFVPKTSQMRVGIAGSVTLVLALGVALVLAPPPPLRDFLMSFHARQLYEREQVLQFVSLQRAWPDVLSQIGLMNLGVAVAAIPLTAAIWPKSRLSREQWLLLGSLVVMIVCTFFLMGLFSTNRAHDRYVILLGFALIWGVALAMLLQHRLWLTLVAATILVIPWFVKDWRLGTGLRLPDTRALTADWFIANVPSGTRLAVEYDHVEFDPGYGGFPSGKVFFVDTITSVHEQSLDSFARRGVEYLVADERNIHRGGFYDDSDDTAFLDQVELVYDLGDPYNNDMRGPRRLVFRIPPIQQFPMHVFLGDAIIFKGYDLIEQTFSPGDTIPLVLYWAALRETDASYTVFAHLVNADSDLVAQLDGFPGDALHRTYDWWPGYFDWDEWPVILPADLPPGTYTLRVGMYDSLTLSRLTCFATDGTPMGDSIYLTEITVR